MHLQPIINSPRPLDIEKALQQCFGSQTSQPFNLSVSCNDYASEEVIKINGMKRKMLYSELRLMISELLEMLRTQNSTVKKEILKYENEMIVSSKNLLAAFLTSKQSNQIEKNSNKCYLEEPSNNRPKSSRNQSSKCQCYKPIQEKYNKQISNLKSQIQKYECQIATIKKQNYKICEDNFSLEQKVKDLQNELQVKTHKLIRNSSAIQNQKQEFQQTLKRLQHAIKEKDIRIQTLENNIRKSKKSSFSRDEEDKCSSSGNRNISQDQVISFQSPLDKGFYSQKTSRYYITPANTQTKQTEVLIPRSIDKRKQLPTKIQSRLLSHPKQPQPKVQYQALTSNRSRNKKSLSKDKFNFEKIGMQLQNLTHELQKDLRRINHRIR